MVKRLVIFLVVVKYKSSVKYNKEMADYDLFATAVATMNDNSRALVL